MPDRQALVLKTIHELVARRDPSITTIALDADLIRDLEMDSLEIAELSAVLEEEYGTDPYSSGLLARTAGEVLAFYEDAPA